MTKHSTHLFKYVGSGEPLVGSVIDNVTLTCSWNMAVFYLTWFKDETLLYSRDLVSGVTVDSTGAPILWQWRLGDWSTHWPSAEWVTVRTTPAQWPAEPRTELRRTFHCNTTPPRRCSSRVGWQDNIIWISQISYYGYSSHDHHNNIIYYHIISYHIIII